MMTFNEFQRLARLPGKDHDFQKKIYLRLIYMGKIAIFVDTNWCYMPVVTRVTGVSFP